MSNDNCKACGGDGYTYNTHDGKRAILAPMVDCPACAAWDAAMTKEVELRREAWIRQFSHVQAHWPMLDCKRHNAIVREAASQPGYTEEFTRQAQAWLAQEGGQ